MTRGSVLEYIEAVRERYRRARKEQKGKILDEFTQVTGYHRKAAIRLLGHGPCRPPRKRRATRSRYGPEVIDALVRVWEASDRLCSKRLKPFMGEMVHAMRVHGELQIDGQVAESLCQISPATIDRLLRPWRRRGGRRPLSTTRPGTLLKSSIPIRTFADWTEGRPGFVEVDLVAHCGESTQGFYLNTLSVVDVATSWCECMPVWGKGQQRVRSGIHRVRQQLPFPLLGLDCDNGSEFINHHLFTYCHDEKIAFTRSRPYKENDNCHVEQKNGSVVRRLIGHDRYNSHQAYKCLELLYLCLRQYVNFFQPTMKLVSKSRHGAKVHKVYDTAKTPYQRLLDSGVLTPEQERRLATSYDHLNPVQLLSWIHGHQEKLWQLAAPSPAHPATHPTLTTPTRKEAVSVTSPAEATIPFGNSLS